MYYVSDMICHLQNFGLKKERILSHSTQVKGGSRSGLDAKSVRIPLHTLQSFPSQSRLVITRIIMADLPLSNLWRRVFLVLVIMHLLDMVVGVV